LTVELNDYLEKFYNDFVSTLLLKTGDRDLEAKVDERLLMRFHCCGWSDENENQEHLENENKDSLQETKVGAA